MHLGNDHPLSTIYNKRAIWGHQRHIAHEYILLFNVFNRLRTGVFIYIKNNQAQRHLQGSCVRHVALLALFNIVFWFFQLVFYELQDSRLVKIFNRENRLENALNTFAV